MTLLWFCAPHSKFTEILQKDLVKTWAFSPKTCLRGIPCPTGPQRKHRYSPLSHFVDAEIFVQSPSNSPHIAARSEVHWAAACWICCMYCSKTTLLEVLLCICAWIPCMCVSLPSIFAMMVKASSIQGWTCAFRIASFCHVASTYSFCALACCIRASL